MLDELKSNVFKAQRMYYLSIKLGARVSPYIRKFSMNVLDGYIRRAKMADLKLTSQELLNRLID